MRKHIGEQAKFCKEKPLKQKILRDTQDLRKIRLIGRPLFRLMVMNKFDSVVLLLIPLRKLVEG